MPQGQRPRTPQQINRWNPHTGRSGRESSLHHTNEFANLIFKGTPGGPEALPSSSNQSSVVSLNDPFINSRRFSYEGTSLTRPTNVYTHNNHHGVNVNPDQFTSVQSSPRGATPINLPLQADPADASSASIPSAAPSQSMNITGASYASTHTPRMPLQARERLNQYPPNSARAGRRKKNLCSVITPNKFASRMFHGEPLELPATNAELEFFSQKQPPHSHKSALRQDFWSTSFPTPSPSPGPGGPGEQKASSSVNNVKPDSSESRWEKGREMGRETTSALSNVSNASNISKQRLGYEQNGGLGLGLDLTSTHSHTRGRGRSRQATIRIGDLKSGGPVGSKQPVSLAHEKLLKVLRDQHKHIYDLRKNGDFLTSNIAQLERKNLRLAQRTEQLAKDLDRSTEQRQVVVTANERQTHTIRSLQQQLDELNGRLFDEESRYKQVDFALKRQTMATDRVKHQSTLKQQQLVQEVENSVKERTALDDQVSTWREQYHEVIEREDTMKELQKTQLDKVELHNNKLQNHLKTAKAQILKHEMNVDELRGKLENVRTTLEGRLVELENANALIIKRTTERDKFISDLDEAGSQNALAEEKFRRKRADYLKCRFQLAVMQIRNSGLEKYREKLDIKENEKQNLLREFDVERKEHEQQVEVLNKRITELREESAEWEKKVSSTVSQSSQQMQQSMAHKHAHLQQQKELQAKASQAEAKLVSVENKCKELNRDNKKLQADLEAKVRQNERLKANLAEALAKSSSSETAKVEPVNDHVIASESKSPSTMKIQESLSSAQDSVAAGAAEESTSDALGTQGSAKTQSED